MLRVTSLLNFELNDLTTALRCFCYSAGLMQRLRGVEGEIELKNIDARFAEDAELPRLGATGDDGA